MATENRHITRIVDAWANRAGLDAGQTMLLTDSTYNYGHIWRYGSSYYLPAVSKSYNGSVWTYYDNEFNDVTVYGDLLAVEYLKHSGDETTNIRFQTGQVTIGATGVTLLNLQNTTQDIVQINPGATDVDFQVSANSIAAALFVQGSSGNIGVNCNDPTYPIEVSNEAGSAAIIVSSFSDTPTHRGNLYLYHARGTRAAPTATQSGDELGGVYFQGFDTAQSNGARIYGIATDNFGTSGDTSDNPTAVRIATCADGSNALVDRLHIGSDGYNGFGTTSPQSTLNVASTVACYLDIIADSNANEADTDAFVRFFVDGVSGTGTQKGVVGYDQGLGRTILGYGSGVAMGIDSDQYIHIPDDKYLFFGNSDDAWITYGSVTNKLIISAEGSSNPIEINADGLLEMYGLDGVKIGDQSLTYGDVDVYCLNGFTVHTNASPSEIAMYAGDEGIDCNVIVKAGYACKATSAGAGGSSGSPTQVDVTAKSFVQLTPTANTQYYTFTGQEDYQVVLIELTTGATYGPIYVNGEYMGNGSFLNATQIYNGSNWVTVGAGGGTI